MTNTIPRKPIQTYASNPKPMQNKTQLDATRRFNFGYLWLLSIIILLAIGWFGFMKVIDWNEHYQIKKQRILSMVWHWPLKVELRQPVIVKETLPSYPGEIDTPFKKYVCDKFGVYDCKVALGISLAEDPSQDPEAININVNKDGSTSLDAGIFQINSVHFKQSGCSLKEVLDPIRATDCAYSIYKAAGNSWHDWTTYNTGAYLTALK